MLKATIGKALLDEILLKDKNNSGELKVEIHVPLEKV